MLPFLLKPYLKQVVWGGDRLAVFKGLSSAKKQIGESWEVSAMPGCESVIETGPLAGMNFAEACAKFSEEILGRRVIEKYGTEFPLLVKFIDAARDLSIQVHPSDSFAFERHGGRGKNEMWYIVDTLPGAAVISGFKTPITIEDFDRHIEEGTIADTLAVYYTRPGEVYYIPAGHIHSACGGNLILEVQQPSNITYRIFDYNRVDTDGNLRELHTELAREIIDLGADGGNRLESLDDCLMETPDFKVAKLELKPGKPFKVEYDSFTIVVMLSGVITGECEGDMMTIPRGHTYFIPAGMPVELAGDGTAILVSV